MAPTPVILELWAVAGFLALALLAIALHGRDGATRIVYGGTLALSLAATAVAGLALGAAASATVLPVGLPWIGAHFRVDALSAFFLLVIDLGGAAASLYALGYGRHEHEPGRVLPFFPAFLAGMNLVLMADDAFAFLVAWEFMSLSSWALVMAHHAEAGNARAGYIYILMASFGTFALLLAFGLLAGPEGHYDFATIRATAPGPVLAGAVLGLALLGTGSKAGLVPLHVWLPLAHPAAPSHVSALMSGVMTKVAIYGFVRIVFDLLGPSIWWWGVPVLAIGGITATVGVLYALMQDDLKRILAYSTIENIGIVFIALGLALAFRANGLAGPAALALTAALFHVFNHAQFKSLLFFGAGAVLTATGERQLEKLGGLIHRMPKTAVVFLVACGAISALPPLNGFASEWMAFQAILLSPELPQWGLKLAVPAAGTLLALAAALAAACFVRVFGVAFLGRPRSKAAAEAREVDGFSISAMAILALVCLAAGILPGLAIDGLGPVMEQLVGARMPRQLDQSWLTIVPVMESRSSYNGLLVFGFIVASASIAAFVIHRLASGTIRRAPPWDCGFPNTDPATQYTAASFAQPIRRVFGASLFRARETVDMPAPGDPRPARHTLAWRDFAWELIYAPIGRTIGGIADRANLLQFLTIRSYLSLVFVALISLLLLLAIWS
ncbi:hydrogenase 4 subunit B [Zavarzinia sp.]|uniref:hydrogenase 4 subunit B n=1 Tax=Zavarzinia sp. TaxID=2027920 RepID=UPI0035691C9E